jgi:hypothetical protein
MHPVPVNAAINSSGDQSDLSRGAGPPDQLGGVGGMRMTRASVICEHMGGAIVRHHAHEPTPAPTALVCTPAARLMHVRTLLRSHTGWDYQPVESALGRVLMRLLAIDYRGLSWRAVNCSECIC